MLGRCLSFLFLIMCLVLPAFCQGESRVTVSLHRQAEQAEPLSITPQEWSATVAALLELRLYDTDPAQAASMMAGKAVPVDARVLRGADAQYTVLAYAASAEPAAPLALLLFRAGHLICVGITYGTVQNSLSFISATDDAWARLHGFDSKELKAVSSTSSTWEKQLLQLAKNGSSLTRKKARTCMLRVPTAEGERYSPLLHGKGCVHFYHHYADEDDDNPKPYFKHGDYLYKRYVAVAFDATGKCLSLCHGLEIGHFQLPEDGSTDPLHMDQDYMLLPK